MSAAVLWSGDSAAAALTAAARLHGWTRFRDARVEIAAVHRRRATRATPFAVHRYDRYLLEDICVVRGVPCTTVRRTLLDLLGRKVPGAVATFDEALRKQQTSLQELSRFYEQQWTRGRRGIAILRSELVERDPSLAPTDSELEDLLWKIIVDFGLPRPTCQFPMTLPRSGDIRIDLAYSHVKLSVEGDGFAWHGDRLSFERDRIRDAELQGLGWVVLRFTWSQIRFERGWVAQTIRSHLARRGAAA